MELHDCKDIFYKKLLLDNNTENEIQAYENICLISQEPLKEPIVKLDCGHTFNYDSLFKYVFNQKTTFNHMEQSKNMLKMDQMMCPYCRNIQNTLLPYLKSENFNKIHGVNHLNISKVPIRQRRCAGFTYINHSFDFTQPLSLIDNPQFIKMTCNKGGTKIKNSSDTNFYCGIHKKMVLKQTKTLKHNKIDSNTVNNVTGDQPEVNETSVCSVILKRGVNKGNNCKCKIYKEGLCKRHFTTYNN